MTETKFEEEFPSLEIHEEEGEDGYYFNVAFIDDVQKHCLDKQRLKDIMRLSRLGYDSIGTAYIDDFIDCISIGLGLDITEVKK